MQRRSRISRVFSLFVAFLLFISTITTAFGAGFSSASPGPQFSGSGPLAGNQWAGGNAQFLRVTLYWAPRATDSSQAIGEDGADWSKVIRVATYDWASANPAYKVVQHSNFTDALSYTKNSNSNAMGTINDYYAKTSTSPLGRVFVNYASYKNDAGQTMSFPLPIGTNASSTTNVKTFFTQSEVINQALWLAKVANGSYTNQSSGFGKVGEKDYKNGIYYDEWAGAQQGTYMFTVEPGVYTPVNGVYTAATMRDIVNWKGNDTILGDTSGVAPSLARNTATSVMLEPNMKYKGLGLEYRPLDPGIQGGYSWMRNNRDTMRLSYGIGVFMQWSKVQQLSLIHI